MTNIKEKKTMTNIAAIPHNFVYDPDKGESSKVVNDVRVDVKSYGTGDDVLYKFRVIHVDSGREIVEPVGGYPDAQDAANAAWILLSRISQHSRGYPLETNETDSITAEMPLRLKLKVKSLAFASDESVSAWLRAAIEEKIARDASPEQIAKWKRVGF